jgi:hypothetical protein
VDRLAASGKSVSMHRNADLERPSLERPRQTMFRNSICGLRQSRWQRHRFDLGGEAECSTTTQIRIEDALVSSVAVVIIPC